MTPEQIIAVQTSFRQVLPIRIQAAELFYTRLFAIDPTTAPLFTGTDLAAQGTKLMAAIGFVVGALRQPEAMLETVRALAVRHVRYGVIDAHYASVGAALLWTLEQGLGPAYTPAVRTAWTAAYALLSSAMIEAARGTNLPLTSLEPCQDHPTTDVTPPRHRPLAAAPVV